MDNILTLNKINRSDGSIAGFRAVDLARLYSKKFNIPICFVIKTSLFNNFLETNDLRPQINNILSEVDYSSDESLDKTYTKIKELFSQFELSKAEQDELLEAYETLAIDMEHLDIAKLVTAIDKPPLTIIGSPNYVDDSENNESIRQNVKGKNALIKAIIDCWLSLYTPKALKYRKNNDINTEEQMAIIVQRMVEPEVSLQSYTDEEEIILKTFIGFQDYFEELEKDITVFSKGTLTIKNTKVSFQEQKYVRDARDDKLVKKDLKEEGEKQKLNDKEVEELARITKKIEGFIEKPVKVFISITKGKIYLLFANRIIRLKEVEEESIEIEEKPVSEEQESESKMNDDNLEDDIAFLDKIEAHEKRSDTESSWVEDSNEPEAKKEDEWTNDTGEEGIKTEEPVVVDTTESKNDSELQAKPETTEQEKEPEIQTETEITETKPYEDIQKEPETTESEKDSEISETKFSEDTQKPEVSDIQAKPETTEEPVPIDDIPEKDDEFIFSGYEETKEPESESEELVDIQTKPETTEQEKEPEIQTETEITETKTSEDIQKEPKMTEQPETTTEKSKLDEALESIRKIAILSDEAICEAMKKKHKTVTGNEATTFEEAIEGLKSTVRIPFTDEINKVHKIRLKAEKGEELEIEEVSMSLRTAKNFLSMFE